MFIVIVLGIAALVFFLAILIAVLLVAGQAKAKKDALKMLEDGKIGDVKQYKKTMRVLATSKDAEAPTLCKQLRELYAKQCAS